MPTMKRVKFETLVTDFGWKLETEHAGVLQFKHPQFPKDVLTINTVRSMGSIVRAGKSRLDFAGLSATKATLKSFHQLEIPQSVKQTAKDDLAMHARIIEETRDAYSFSTYGAKAWARCIVHLHRHFNLSEREIIAIMRSKWTRWAADQYSATPLGLARYLNHNVNMQRDLPQLVAETFPTEEEKDVHDDCSACGAPLAPHKRGRCNDCAVKCAIAQYPKEFGLRKFPNKKFTFSFSASYVNESGAVMLYACVWTGDKWESFCKEEAALWRSEIVAVPAEPEPEPEPGTLAALEASLCTHRIEPSLCPDCGPKKEEVKKEKKREYHGWILVEDGGEGFKDYIRVEWQDGDGRHNYDGRNHDGGTGNGWRGESGAAMAVEWWEKKLGKTILLQPALRGSYRVYTEVL